MRDRTGINAAAWFYHQPGFHEDGQAREMVNLFCDGDTKYCGVQPAKQCLGCLAVLCEYHSENHNCKETAAAPIPEPGQPKEGA